MKFSFLTLLFVGSCLFITKKSFAEPWISNRYGQNCAACHAPGRYNLKPKKRRCTLSCQGCHVNPNGGGLRNQYGKWNQQRWLKSFYHKKYLGNKKAPAPDRYQNYMASSKKLRYKYKGPKTKKRGRTRPKLIATAKLDHNASNYDKFTNDDWNTNVSKKVFLTRIPNNDPYKLERNNLVQAGGDFRYFFGNFTISTPGQPDREVEFDSIMAADFGVRVRPVRENLSLVFEHRTLSDGTGNIDQALGYGNTLRSAYVLVDDLMYNTWIQAGLYRPMFGLYNPDHQSLSSRLSGFDQRVLFKGFAIGTAPNVPFLNVHMISSVKENSSLGNSTFNGNSIAQDGINVNTGLRFVTYSANLKLSYWKTKTHESYDPLQPEKEMYSLTTGGKFGRFIANTEFLRWSVVSNNGEDAGNVYTLDTKYRLWREIYGTLLYAQSNTFTTGTAGEATELVVGLKGYLYAGLKGELLVLQKSATSSQGPTPTEIESTGAMAQLHFYF